MQYARSCSKIYAEPGAPKTNNEIAPTREAIVDIASSYLGAISVRYAYGRPELGQSPKDGFDCSGFVKFVLNEAGLFIPPYIDINGQTREIRHTSEFWDHYGIGVHDGLQLPGDLILFSHNGYSPTHMGIVRDEESYIHAPGSNNTKVEIDEIARSPITPNPTTTRVVFKNNPIGFKSPVIPIVPATYRFYQQAL